MMPKLSAVGLIIIASVGVFNASASGEGGDTQGKLLISSVRNMLHNPSHLTHHFFRGLSNLGSEGFDSRVPEPFQSMFGVSVGDDIYRFKKQLEKAVPAGLLGEGSGLEKTARAILEVGQSIKQMSESDRVTDTRANVAFVGLVKLFNLQYFLLTSRNLRTLTDPPGPWYLDQVENAVKRLISGGSATAITLLANTWDLLTPEARREFAGEFEDILFLILLLNRAHVASEGKQAEAPPLLKKLVEILELMVLVSSKYPEKGMMIASLTKALTELVNYDKDFVGHALQNLFRAESNVPSALRHGALVFNPEPFTFGAFSRIEGKGRYRETTWTDVALAITGDIVDIIYPPYGGDHHHHQRPTLLDLALGDNSGHRHNSYLEGRTDNDGLIKLLNPHFASDLMSAGSAVGGAIGGVGQEAFRAVEGIDFAQVASGLQQAGGQVVGAVGGIDFAKVGDRLVKAGDVVVELVDAFGKLG